MLVLHLDRDLPSIALRQQLPANLGRGLGSRAFGGVETVELEADFIRDEPRPLADVEVVADMQIN
jgi:hypothetical protein